MSAAYFRRVNIAVRILLERAVILPKNKTGEDNSLIAARASLQTIDVLLRVRRITDDQQAISSSHFLECLNDEVSIVFRFEPRYIQNISIWLHSPLPNGIPIQT